MTGDASAELPAPPPQRSGPHSTTILRGGRRITKNRVFATITSGSRLLLFRHTDIPAAALRVPAGKVRDGEALDVAVRREVAEASGLPALPDPTFPGQLRVEVARLRKQINLPLGEVHA